MPTIKRRPPKKPSKKPSRPVTSTNEPVFEHVFAPVTAAAATAAPPAHEFFEGVAGVPGPGLAVPFAFTAPHKDSRGAIQNLAHTPVGSVAVIISNADTTRARHYHLKDAHICYVVEGSIHYFVRRAGAPTTPESAVFSAGQGFLTYPMEEHEMYFPSRTVFVVLGNLSRTHEDYEADLVRLPVSLRDIYNAAHGGPAVVDPNARLPRHEPDNDPNVIPEVSS